MLLNAQGDLITDTWQIITDGEVVPDQGDVLVDLSVWESLKHEGRSGILLDNTQDVLELAEILPQVSLFALQFPKFNDGRAYSQARLLRERMDYRGELRAIGDVLRDQVWHMARCGFDTMLLRSDQDAEDCALALREVTAI